MTGTVVVWHSGRGYGFIRPDDAAPGSKGNVFVHYTGIVGTGRRDLETGERVSYDLSENDKGPLAINVTRENP